MWLIKLNLILQRHYGDKGLVIIVYTKHQPSIYLETVAGDSIP